MLVLVTLACGRGNSELQKGMVYRVDFEKQTSDWDDSNFDDFDGAFRRHENGGYHMASSYPNATMVSVLGFEKLKFNGDVTVEVEATPLEINQSGIFGLMCRYQRTETGGDYYGFYFVPPSSVLISKVVNENTEDLIFKESVPVQAETGVTYHLRADCIGDNLIFYINDQVVHSTTDAALNGEHVGLAVGNLDFGEGFSPGIDVQFDNFSVTRP